MRTEMFFIPNISSNVYPKMISTFGHMKVKSPSGSVRNTESEMFVRIILWSSSDWRSDSSISESFCVLFSDGVMMSSLDCR